MFNLPSEARHLGNLTRATFRKMRDDNNPQSCSQNYYVRDSMSLLEDNYYERYNYKNFNKIITDVIIMRIFDANDFGAAVRAFRKKKGYTQQQLADYSGCSLMYISNLERGKETAELGKALRVLAILGIDIHALPRDGSDQ